MHHQEIGRRRRQPLHPSISVFTSSCFRCCCTSCCTSCCRWAVRRTDLPDPLL